MQKYVITAATLLTAGLIAGCGGGTGSTPSAATNTSISGKVADGYLVNATVFLDKNGNYQLDAGEPSATTDAAGNYVLPVDPADVGKYPIVAMATKGVTIDMDNPNTPISSSYILSIPATAVSGTASSNFVSPMSSQLREMMETGNYTTMQQAMDALRTQLGLPAGTNMLADYMAANNTAMHTAAQDMASLMGSQMAQVMGNGTTPTTVDVNRYRAMMGTILSNMPSIQGPNATTAMTNLMGSMTTTLANMPMMAGITTTTPAGTGTGTGTTTTPAGGMMTGTTTTTIAGTGTATGTTTTPAGGMMTGTTTPTTVGTGAGTGTTTTAGGMMG